MIKKVVKVLALFVIVVASVLFAFANYSAVTTHYICTMTSGEPETVFVALKKHRTWANFGDSDGTLWIEEDGGVLHLFTELEITSIMIWFQKPGGDIFTRGRWSTISNRLAVNLAGRRFDGNCHSLD